MKRILVIYFILNSFGLASAQPCAVSPKRKNLNLWMYKKSPVQIDTAIVKTSGIYLLSDSFSLNGIIQPIFSFYRFFDNGRVYISGPYCSTPTTTEANDLNYGKYGHYKVIGDSITIETFSAASRYYYIILGVENVQSLTLRGTLDRSRFFKPEYQPDYRQVNLFFHSYNLTTVPDW